ncbi:MAG: SIS domain-containing protein [Dehalococcoidia bacterium]|nr:SIS domain-containing protein [Dehalococcoidia bacterium]
MTRLDDPGAYAIDASGMFGHIEKLGEEFERAWLASLSLGVPGASYDNVVIAAMGGSAAAGDYFAAHSDKQAPIPIEVVRGYSLPGYAGPRTLVVALSYSGATEESLSCYREARMRGASVMAISTGGELARRAEADGIHWHRIAYASPPRAALGHTLAALMRIGQRLGLNALCDPDVADVAQAHRELVRGHVGPKVAAERNPAKQLAELLAEADPLVVLAAEHLAPVGRRTKNQFAENAKAVAVFEEVPEATHNFVVGLETGQVAHPVGLAFTSPKASVGNQRRFELLSGIFDAAGGAMAGLPTRGISRLADQFEATAWGDHLSCYLALLRGVDPTPTPSLQRVRAAMAQETARRA